MVLIDSLLVFGISLLVGAIVGFEALGVPAT